MASPDGVSQPHFVTADFLPPIPEHECFTGRGELQLITPALSRASSLSGSGSGSGSGGSGHLSLLSSSLGGALGHDEEDDEDVETAAGATAASLAGNPSLFDAGLEGCGEGCSMRESLSRLSSHHDLAFEWSMLCQECTQCWSGTGKLDPIGARGVSKRKRC